MKTTFKKMSAINLDELISFVKPAVQSLSMGAATIVLHRMGVPSSMIFLITSAAVKKM